MALPRPLPSTTPHYPTPFLRAVSLSLSVLPSFYFFSLSKKNTSKFQNETNENKNRVVLFFILQKIYHIIISFTHMTYRRNTRAQSMFVVDQEIKRSIKLKLNEKTKQIGLDCCWNFFIFLFSLLSPFFSNFTMTLILHGYSIKTIEINQNKKKMTSRKVESCL